MKHFRLWAVVVGVAYTAALWMCCIPDAFSAGPSAEMGGQALGLGPRAMALHQVWLLSARIAISLKVASPEVTINALSALFAGAALCGLLVVFYRLLACAMSRVSVSTLFFESDDYDAPQPLINSTQAVITHMTDEFTRREKTGLLLGTIGAGWAFAFSAPLWSTATRAGPNAFDILLVLLAVWLTTSFCLKPTLWGACIASAVTGIGLAETPLFLAVGCALVFFYLRTVLHNDLSFQRYFVAAVCSACVGFALQLGLASLLLRESVGGAVPLARVLRAMVDGHFHALIAVQISPYWMWTLLWAGIPFVVALSLSLSGQSSYRFNVVVCMGLGIAALAPVLLNFPYTPWSVWRGIGAASVITSLLIVFASGFFVCRWWQLATLPSPAAGLSRKVIAEDIEPTKMVRWLALRVMGIAGFVCVVALLAVQPWLNWEIVAPQGLRAQTVTEFDATGAVVAATDPFAVDVEADAETLARLAMDLLDQGRVDEVEQSILPRLSKMRPPLGRDQMDLLRGRVLLARGGRGLESARIFFLRLLPRGLPEENQIADWLLEVGLQNQDWTNVERDCQTIRRLLPNHPRANEVLGQALIKRGAPRLAVSHLQMMLNTMTNAALLTVLGEAHLRSDESAQARIVLEQAARRPDATGNTYLLLARALLEQGESDMAVRVLDETPAALRIPGLVLFHANLLYERGQPAACRQVLTLLDERRTEMTLRQQREWESLLAKTAGAERMEIDYDDGPKID